MTAVAVPVVQGTDAWLAARQEGIGSSDAPVVAGERPGYVALWAVKAGLIDPEPPDAGLARLFEWGHRLEPVVAEWYSDTTGRPLRRVNRLQRHPDVPWAIASLDRVSAVKGERRIVEIKTTRHGWTATEPVPGDVQAQIQHQLWVTGYDVADVAVLKGGSEPSVVEVPRDDGFIADLQALEAEFWAYVERRERPPVDGSEETRRALTRMYPAPSETWLPASPEWDELAGRLRAAKEVAKGAADEEATLENAVRAMLGEASGVEGDGYRLTWLQNKPTTKVDWKNVADGLMAGLDTETREAVLSLNTITTPGPRTLRAKWG